MQQDTRAHTHTPCRGTQNARAARRQRTAQVQRRERLILLQGRSERHAAFITDAVASLAAPLGLGTDEYGVLQPALSFPVTAYAITNPIWVARGASFEPPGTVPLARQKSRNS